MATGGGASNTDPVGAGLLQLYEARFNTRQAQLDLERAQAKEQLAGRTAVPGVFAQLQANADKKAAREQKIAKAQEQQQATGPTAAELTPPMVDVSGQASARGSGGSSIAPELIDAVSGGGGIKRGQVPAPPGQGPVGPSPLEQATGVQRPAPGSTVRDTVPLTGTQRAVRGIGGMIVRSPGMVEEAITGQETVGFHQVPTPQEQGQALAKPLSAYISMAQSPNTLKAQWGQQQLEGRLQQIEQELGPEAAESAYIQAQDLYAIQEEERLRKAEDPETIRKRQIGAIQTKVLESGKAPEDVLNPGELAVFKGGQRSTTNNVTVNAAITKATQSKLEQETTYGYEMLQMLDTVDQNFYPDAFTLAGKARYSTLKNIEAIGGNLTDEQRTELQRFADNERAVGNLSVTEFRRTAGKTMTPTEIERIEPLLVGLTRSPTQAAANKEAIREDVGLSILRNQVLLKGGVSDPKFAMSLGDTRGLAKNMAEARFEELTKGGLSAVDAQAQVTQEFRRTYGLDLKRLMSR